ncbi:MAG: hypothetical protein DMG35_16170 [Acidobacteria bacterium]|nr:MAG: hypothetical protein DMG35_16170 [Acidobacteriota bacterium]
MLIGQAIWWACIALEGLLLVRGFQGRLLARYPVFYAYLFFVCSQSLLRFSVYHSRPQLYGKIYWITEWMGILIGCGVVFEIYRVGLSAYPGTARLARNLLAFVFVLAFAKAVIETGNNPQWWSTATTMDLELALRVVQALALVALVVLFLFYSIPFGRNLRGMLQGYALFIGESIVWLAFVSWGGEKFRAFWSHIHPGFYFVVLSVWAVHLWSYVPNPQPRGVVRFEEQYERIAAATNRRLQEVRGYLARAVRP